MHSSSPRDTSVTMICVMPQTPAWILNACPWCGGTGHDGTPGFMLRPTEHGHAEWCPRVNPDTAAGLTSRPVGRTLNNGDADELRGIARRMHDADIHVDTIAETLDVHRTTVYRWIHNHKKHP